MPWNPELVNTVVSIYRPTRGSVGGNITGTTLVALKLPAYMEEREDLRQQNVPVASSSDSRKIKIWIEGVDNSGNALDIQSGDLIEWQDHFTQLPLDPRWQIDRFRPWGGQMAGDKVTIDHMVLEASP